MPSQGVLAWLRLARVYQKIDRASVRHLHDWGLSHAQFDVLVHVRADEGLSQQELADALLVTKGNVCQLLDRLERSGLVTRQPEGRTNRVFLTDAGRRVAEAAIPAQEAQITEIFEQLSPEEQRQLSGLLRKLDRGLG